MMETSVRVGKNGFSKGMLEEIKHQLARKKVVKIKFLRSFLAGRDRIAEAQRLASLVGAQITEQVGLTAVLRK
jgi:RNA-binding protein YhbY